MRYRLAAETGMLMLVILAPGCGQINTQPTFTPQPTVSPIPPAIPATPSASPLPSETRFEFEVTNPLSFDRPHEFVSIRLHLPDGYLAEVSHNSVVVIQVDAPNRDTLLADLFDSSLVRWPSGGIQSMEVGFFDSFGAGETRRYELLLEETSSFQIEPLAVEELGPDGPGDALHINNGEYDFYVGHELEPLDAEYGGLLPRDLYIRIESEDGWAKSMPLTQIYGNTAVYREEFGSDDCEPLFLLSPGFPEEIQTLANRVTVDVSLRYTGWAHEYCPPAPTYGKLDQNNLIEALVTLRIYRDLPRVDAQVSVTVHDTFFNHNGLGMGGVETELLRPRVIFGTENHIMLQGSVWADTTELTDLPEFMQIQDGKFVFRRGANRDAWAPFALIAEENNFLDYYVVEGEGGRGVLGYFPDFEDLANRKTRDEGSGEILALNMIGAGPSIPVNVANPILISQTHLGGLGEVWAEVPKGTYDYRLITVAELPFAQASYASYDQLAQSLSLPLKADLWVGE